MRLALGLALAGVVALAAAAEAGGRVRPPGVRLKPEAAAAVGARDLWVLAEYRCDQGYCNSLIRSRDAGRHFVRVGFPSLPSQETVPTVVFANAHDGFAYVVNATPLYATHDGGGTWHRVGPNRSVDAFAEAGGYAYLLAGRHHIERSRVGRNAWRRLPLRVPQHPFSLAAHGSDVWFLGLPRHRPDFDTVALSSDHGQTFVERKGPCLAELGGTLVPAASGVVWAVCPTGMMAELALSRNGGRTFPSILSAHEHGGLRQPGLVNSARIAAPSARVAVLSRGAGGALLRTTDTGRHWKAVPRTAGIQDVFWLAFTTRRVGATLVQTRHGMQLWRTADAGTTWHSVPLH
jgi:photosystem II stability/assembly factor-like uncharacterized protein